MSGFCVQYHGQVVSQNTNKTCLSEQGISILSCLFINLLIPKGFGGAMYVNVDNSDIYIEKTSFYNCFAQYGGALYILGDFNMVQHSVCFDTCESPGVGQVSYLYAKMHAIDNKDLVSAVRCSPQNGYHSVFRAISVSASFRRVNTSYNHVTQTCSFFYAGAKKIDVALCCNDHNVETIVYETPSCIQGEIRDSNFVNNTYTFKDYGMFYNMNSNNLFFIRLNVILNSFYRLTVFYPENFVECRLYNNHFDLDTPVAEMSVYPSTFDIVFLETAGCRAERVHSAVFSPVSSPSSHRLALASLFTYVIVSA